MASSAAGLGLTEVKSGCYRWGVPATYGKFLMGGGDVMAEERKESRFQKSLGTLESYRVSLVALGAALTTIGLATFGAVWHPAWVLNFLGIQEKIGDSYPTISNVGNIQLAAEASNVFEKLGPVGDFFGGTVNPILTFISIWLLIHSIRIQRDEMQDATRQARKSAKAAKRALKVAKISERPYLVVEKFSLEKSESQYLQKLTDRIHIKVLNLGKTIAFIQSVEVVDVIDDHKQLKIFSMKMQYPVKDGMSEYIRTIQSGIRIDNLNLSEWRERSDIVLRLDIMYKDFYDQTWFYSGDFDFIKINPCIFEGNLIDGNVYDSPFI